MKLSFQISSTLQLYDLLNYLKDNIDSYTPNNCNDDFPQVWTSVNKLWSVSYTMKPNGVCGSNEFVELTIDNTAVPDDSIWSYINLRWAG